MLEKWQRDLIILAGRKLDCAHMIRFEERTGTVQFYGLFSVNATDRKLRVQFCRCKFLNLSTVILQVHFSYPLYCSCLLPGYFSPTDLGRTSSHYYIKYRSIETFNELLNSDMDITAILAMISKSHEFDQMKVIIRFFKCYSAKKHLTEVMLYFWKHLSEKVC